jgi:hypothetical protein
MSRLGEEQKTAMSRLGEEQKTAMSRLGEEQKTAMSRLGEEQNTARGDEQNSWWKAPEDRDGKGGRATRPDNTPDFR